ncbi:MAG: 16S rRNA processing protein RimM [Clostridia bacterium]|nr:16S rRNA processing protein RimM [Clostridia bacterium]
MKSVIECGRIVNTHGIAGEVKIENYCDEGFYKRISRITAGSESFEVLSSRTHKGFVLARLEGVNTVEDAMRLKGKTVFANREDIDMPRGHVFYSDLYGFDVYDRRVQRVIGKLKEVRESTASMLYIIESEGKEILVPDVPAFSRGYDLRKQTVEIETIEGMLPDED